jgi:hypothetical protein
MCGASYIEWPSHIRKASDNATGTVSRNPGESGFTVSNQSGTENIASLDAMLA